MSCFLKVRHGLNGDQLILPYRCMYEQLCQFECLLAAYKKARRHKQDCWYVCKFDFFLEDHLLKLRRELLTERYMPSPYTYFIVHEPKTRHVAAPAFRDRVVQHALVSLIGPRFEASFIADSYACLSEKGTHYGMLRLKKFLQSARSVHGPDQPLYVLRGDISRYFPSMQWDILLSLVEKKISCPKTRRLIEAIVCTNVVGTNKYGATRLPEEVVSIEKRRGLPIGNLTSQLFANVYLNRLDHYIKEELGLRWYGRYMDDFFILHPSSKALQEIQEQIRVFAEEELALTLHPRKTTIQSTSQGVPFVGYRVFPDHVLVRSTTLQRFQRKYNQRRKAFQKGLITAEQLQACQDSFRGHLSHCDSYGLSKQLFK